MLGDIAHDNGLGTSLLQRLYYRYLKFGEESKECSVLLRFNHRSHHDLLHLLSDLFYNSELRAFDDVKPHPKEPYPLKFICSNLENIIGEKEPISDREVRLILKQVEKVHDKNSICIMTTNTKQVPISIEYDCIYRSIEKML